MEEVELRNEEGNVFLFLRDNVLGVESTTTPYMSVFFFIVTNTGENGS
jgi:hypothetical protein